MRRRKTKKAVVAHDSDGSGDIEESFISGGNDNEYECNGVVIVDSKPASSNPIRRSRKTALRLSYEETNKGSTGNVDADSHPALSSKSNNDEDKDVIPKIRIAKKADRRGGKSSTSRKRGTGTSAVSRGTTKM